MRYKVVEHHNKLDVSLIHGTAIHRVILKNSHIDLLIKGFEDISYTSSVLVCFTAAVSNRENKTAPFFSGLGVSTKLNIPLISIADPTVSDYSVGLAWYAGNEKIYNLQYEISRILKDIFNYLKFKQYILFGGSGAGFACLTQLMLIRDIKLKSLVMNPQTSILEYTIPSVKRYVTQAFEVDCKSLHFDKELAKAIFERNNIVYQIDVNSFDSSSELIYLQNSTDWHVKSHLIPFVKNSSTSWKRAGNCSFYNNERLAVYMGNWGKGHVTPPKEIIYHLISGLVDGKSPIDLLQNIENRLLAFDENADFFDDQEFDLEWDFDVVVKDNSCKVKVYSSALKNIIDIEYAFYLIVDEDIIVSKKLYTAHNIYQFSIKDYDINRLSVKAFVKLPNGRRLSKRKRVFI